MTFQLKDKAVLIEAVRSRLEKRSIRFNAETLSQFIDSKAAGVNQIQNPNKPRPAKTEIGVETIQHWVRDFVRIYCSEPNI